MKQLKEFCAAVISPSYDAAILGCTLHQLDGNGLASWWTARGLARLSWISHLNSSESDLIVDPSPEWGGALTEALEQYGAGEVHSFNQIPVDLSSLPAFSRIVLEACRKIAPGKVTTYGQLAEQVNAPNAARGVGQAMARNPIPLVIPCHRVVGASGGLTGYSGLGGLETKRRLLRWEQAAASGHRGRLEDFSEYPFERLSSVAVN